MKDMKKMYDIQNKYNMHIALYAYLTYVAYLESIVAGYHWLQAGRWAQGEPASHVCSTHYHSYGEDCACSSLGFWHNPLFHLFRICTVLGCHLWLKAQSRQWEEVSTLGQWHGPRNPEMETWTIINGERNKIKLSFAWNCHEYASHCKKCDIKYAVIMQKICQKYMLEICQIHKKYM